LEVKRARAVETDEEETRAAEDCGEWGTLNLEVVADGALEGHDGASVHHHLFALFERTANDGSLTGDARGAVADEPFAG